MVGNGAILGANAAVHGLGPDELLVLCSDGVHKHLDGADWCSVLGAPASLAQRSQALLALARKRGSVDDATVLLLERSDPDERALAWRGRAAVPFDAPGSKR
jgi:serine/threonine protein phosphatase PrpC